MGRRGNGEGSIYQRKDGRWMGRYTVYTASGPKQMRLVATPSFSHKQENTESDPRTKTGLLGTPPEGEQVLK